MEKKTIAKTNRTLVTVVLHFSKEKYQLRIEPPEGLKPEHRVPSLRSDSQQLHEISAQDRFLFGIIQECRPKYEVHRDGPVVRYIRTINNLADTDFSDEMPQSLFAENHGVHKDLLLEILSR